MKKNNYNLDNISWNTNFVANSKKPAMIIANEFFDCLPVRQFYKKDNNWFEKMVIYNHENKNLKITDKEIKSIKTKNLIKDYNPSEVLEISKSREKYFAKICKYIFKFGGIMMIFDYGYYKKPKNFTLQSLYRNKKSNIIDNLGNQDITSLVDFKKMIEIAKFNKINIDYYTTQRDFLLKYGILERSKQVLKKSKPIKKKMIIDGLNRIINKNNMGSLFKVLIISK